jgi:hypothetical protein
LLLSCVSVFLCVTLLVFPCVSLLMWSCMFHCSLVLCFFCASLFLHVLVLLYGLVFFCVSLLLHASLFTYALILRRVSLLPFSSTFMFLVISFLLCFVHPSCFVTPLPNVLEIHCCKFGVWEEVKGNKFQASGGNKLFCPSNDAL